jgi:regulator of replication initiation timing
MLREIETLLTSDEPTVETLESKLTEGYAEALALEAERWRLERRLGEVAREGGADLADEVSSIGERLNSTDGELERLRAMLGTLHERARSARKR